MLDKELYPVLLFCIIPQIYYLNEAGSIQAFAEKDIIKLFIINRFISSVCSNGKFRPDSRFASPLF